MGGSPSNVSPATVFARPTADDVWLGPSQRAALSGLRKGPSLRVLIGGPSTGKSVLLNHALRQPDSALYLRCSGPRRGAHDVLTALLSSAELAAGGLGELDQRNLLSVFVQHRRAQGQRVIVVSDDAHLFGPGAWREVDRLRRIEVGGEPAVEVLCAGRPSLPTQIEASAGGAPSAALLRLDPPSPDDVASYVAWRLRRFGLGELFTPLAVQLVARLGGGRFRAVDVLCQMAMLLAKGLGSDRIDAHTVRQAMLALSTRYADRVREAAAGHAALPEARLIVSLQGRPLKRIGLGTRTLIGRSEHNDVSLPSPHLSRHHAAIVGTPAGYYIVDLNSANGLEVNGRRTDRAVLCDLDVVGIGPYRLKIRMAAPSVGDPLPPLESLAATGEMPKAVEPLPSIRRVK
jgi:hypothetical protein